MKQIAIVRVRGKRGVNKNVVKTLTMLRLYNNHHCVVYPANPVILGMLQKAKDYITWGEIDNETLLALLKERGRLPGNKKLTEEYLKEKVKLDMASFVNELAEVKKSLKDIPGLKLFFKLKPPAKGFERKGIKTPFSLGGALGYRKDKINDLIQRMI